MSEHPLVEVCVESIEGARLAAGAGADRIELNRHLKLDGLTPSFDACATFKRELQTIPLIAMLRPHAVGFVYDQHARQQIERDLTSLLAVDVDGIAFGALSDSGRIDERLMTFVRRLSEGKQLVMHRAFDLVADQRQGLQALIDLGVDRVLTSGGMPTAELGLKQLRLLVEWGGDRIEILPGGGVNLTNAQAILDGTGCTQLHGTFKQAGRVPLVPDPHEIANLKQLEIAPKRLL